MELRLLEQELLRVVACLARPRSLHSSRRHLLEVCLGSHWVVVPRHHPVDFFRRSLLIMRRGSKRVLVDQAQLDRGPSCLVLLLSNQEVHRRAHFLVQMGSLGLLECLSSRKMQAPATLHSKSSPRHKVPLSFQVLAVLRNHHNLAVRFHLELLQAVILL